ncbi:MAG: hypothetical protein ACFFCF_04540 [Promethearchaeota archaeon]
MTEVRLPSWLRWLNFIIGIIAFLIGVSVILYPDVYVAYGIVILGILFLIKIIIRTYGGVTYTQFPAWQQYISIIIGFALIILGLPVILLPGFGDAWLNLLILIALVLIGVDQILNGLLVKTNTQIRRILHIVFGLILVILGFVNYLFFGLGILLTLYIIAFALVIIGLDALIQGLTGYQSA